MNRLVLTGILILSGIILAGTGSVARAARLRPYVTVGGTAVHLSDLFSGLEPGQDCTLGPAPAPGEQIVVGGAQLQAIADEFGVSWSAGQGSQNVMLSRPGEKLNRDTVVEAVRRALTVLGMDAESDVNLSDWTDRVVDPGTSVAVRAPAFDRLSGRFSAVLTLTFGGQTVEEIPVDGRTTVIEAILVSARPIMAGQVLSQDDLVVTKRPRDQLSADAIRSMSDAIGLVATRPLPTGATIDRSALRAPSLVVRGSVVMLRLIGGGLSLSAGGLAADTGALGDRVRVVNPSSKAVLVGTVSGRATVTIDAGSTPMIVGSGIGDATLPPGFPDRTSLAYAGAAP